MKTKFVINKPEPEVVQEVLLSLEQYAGNEATIMLTEPSGRKVPLVGVENDGKGRLRAVRWGVGPCEFIDQVENTGTSRIRDQFKD